MSQNKIFHCAYFAMHFRIKFLLFNDFPSYIHCCCCVLSSCVSMCRYVSHPDGQPVTVDYILNGLYQVEMMGRQYGSFVHLTGPFDPNGKRLEGNYVDPLPIRQ